MLYVIAPFFGWLISGSLKFIINYLKYGKEAKSKIGNGGFPSTHTTIITTPTMLIGLKEGFTSPIFGLGIAVTYIIIIDAIGLRRAIGRHAQLLNKLISESLINKDEETKLRESMGHTKIEVTGGLVLGIILGSVLNYFF